MSSRLKGMAILLAFLAVGMIMGWLAHAILAFPPGDHKNIAENVFVYDATYQRYQTLRFERSGEARQMSIIPLFVSREKTYKYSLWTFGYEGDVNAVMWIWGPDENNQYYIEVAKLAANRIDVTWPGGSKDVDITYVGKLLKFNW